MLTDKEYLDIAGVILGKVANQIRVESPTFFPPAILAIKDSPVGQRELTYVPLSDLDPARSKNEIFKKLGHKMAAHKLVIDACFYVTESWVGDPILKQEGVAIFGLNRAKTQSTVAAVHILRDARSKAMKVGAVSQESASDNILTNFFEGYEAFHQSPP